MTEPAAIKGTFSDYKLIKTRKVIQIIVEVPVEQQAQVFAALGYPMPDSETWVGVARLDPEKVKVRPDTPEKPRRPFHDLPLSQQAGIRCGDEKFVAWLEDASPAAWRAAKNYSNDADIAAVVVRFICGVGSRADLDKTEADGPRQIWKKLNAEYEIFAGLAAEDRS